MGNMAPLLLQLVVKNAIPIVTGYVQEKVNQHTYQKLHNLEGQRINKQRSVILRGPSSTSGSTTSLTKGFLPNETIEDLGRRKWGEYHSKIDSLPENASEVQVHNAMKEITDNIHQYPCLTCRENAKRNLKKFPLLVSEVKTKRDGQVRLCNFHNVVRTMLNKPITHNCEDL